MRRVAPALVAAVVILMVAALSLAQAAPAGCPPEICVFVPLAMKPGGAIAGTATATRTPGSAPEPSATATAQANTPTTTRTPRSSPTYTPTSTATATATRTATPTRTATATATRTATPTRTATATRTPTPTQLPPSFNGCQEDPNADDAPDYPVRIVTVIKGSTPEIVRLQNVSGQTVNLNGWTMCSITGNQEHDGIGGTLSSNQVKDFPYTGAGNIWNNANPDDGALYDPQGHLVSYWEDPN
jgi:hypothetical protein